MSMFYWAKQHAMVGSRARPSGRNLFFLAQRLGRSAWNTDWTLLIVWQMDRAGNGSDEALPFPWYLERADCVSGWVAQISRLCARLCGVTSWREAKKNIYFFWTIMPNVLKAFPLPFPDAQKSHSQSSLIQYTAIVEDYSNSVCFKLCRSFPLRSGMLLFLMSQTLRDWEWREICETGGMLWWLNPFHTLAFAVVWHMSFFAIFKSEVERWARQPDPGAALWTVQFTGGTDLCIFRIQLNRSFEI